MYENLPCNLKVAMWEERFHEQETSSSSKSLQLDYAEQTPRNGVPKHAQFQSLK